MTLDLIRIRRDLHQIPELGLEEHETQNYLMDQLQKMNKPYISQKCWQTGILVFVQGYAPEKTIGWRTDMDGLPIVEETGLDFSSQHEGRMHACGHDVHMTIALGLLEKIAEQQPKHNMLFLFQPAEENLAGAKLMYDDGAFTWPPDDDYPDDGVAKNWLPDEFYALHVRPDMKVGQLATNTGTLFAGTCEVKITFRGKGGHAAFPHQTKDALVAASYFVTQVQTVVSRNVDPIEGGVVTFGHMKAGMTNNIIADTAFLHGTIRSLTQENSLLMQERVRQLAEGVAQSFDMDVDIELNQGGYLPVENDPHLAKKLMIFFENHENVEMLACPPAMTGEDFGYLLQQVPGVMFWLGVETPYPLHHPKMSPNEAAIPLAVEAISAFLKTKVC